MANIVVSNTCNLNCPYCFASDHMMESQGEVTQPFIQVETFEQHLDIIDEMKVGQIRLIGGEPTLHPHFTVLLDKALKRDKPILVFSNGLIPPKVVEALEKNSPDVCMVLINMSAANGTQGLSQLQSEHRSRVIHRLGPRVRLGFNISQPNFTLDGLFEVIQISDCQRSIRLGLAHPILHGSNRYLRPKHYPKAGNLIATAAIKGHGLGITLEFDCGFVRCMFSDDDIENLKRAGADYGWRCSPVLDMDISGKVFHCYPLANRFYKNLSLESDLGNIRDRFIEETSIFRTTGIYPECSICLHKQSGECMGGCLANVIKRFRRNDLDLKIASIKLSFFGNRRDKP